MTEVEFSASIDRLKKYLRVNLENEQLDVYYQRFCRLANGTFEKAIDRLIDTHDWRSFPLIPEFNEAVKEVLDERTGATIDELDSMHCEKCNDLGRYITPDGGQGQETLCGCHIGTKVRAGRKEYVKNYGTGYRTAPVRKRVVQHDYKAEAAGEDKDNVPF